MILLCGSSLSCFRPYSLVSPLWWRYLQNLRQSLDAQQRWPYLGNAAKYFCAAQVAVVGIFFPSQRHTTWWLFAFAAATLYQIWWDVRTACIRPLTACDDSA
jgi:EXS family